MSVQWFVLRGEQTEGPFNSSELKLLADQRQISPDNLVKQGVSGPWIPAGTIEGLFVEYHGAKPAPSLGSPPPVRYVKPREQKVAVLATPPTLAPSRPTQDSVEQAPSEGGNASGAIGLSGVFGTEGGGTGTATEQVPLGQRPSAIHPHPKESAGTVRQTAHAPMDETRAPAAGLSAPAEDAHLPIWYLRTPDGQQYGPVNKSQLDQWVAEGRVGHDCWLWRAGWPNWQGAGAVYSSLGQPSVNPPLSESGVSSAGVAVQAAGGAAGVGSGPTGLALGPTIPSALHGLDDPQRWVGQTLGHYQLVEPIGRGPSGLVYKARHVALERWAAVRLIPTGGDSRLFEQLSQGLRSAVRLSHPHLVEVHDMGDTGGVVYVAMEWMEGGSLADWIRRSVRLPAPAVLAIFHQVVSALAAVHMAGLLHGDIKPSNILFTGQGSAKLSDLGLAALTEARLRAGPGSVGSSVYYTAPEILQGQAASVRSDLYSLGATFYHALSGHAPGEGIPMEELFRRRADIPIPPIGTIVSGLPSAMAAMIDRLLLKDTHLRFSSAGEVLQMWERIGGMMGVSAGTATAASPSLRSASPGIPPSAVFSSGQEAAGGWTKLFQTWRNASWKIRLGVGLIGLLVLLAAASMVWMILAWRKTPEVPQEASPPSPAEAPAQSFPEQPQ